MRLKMSASIVFLPFLLGPFLIGAGAAQEAESKPPTKPPETKPENRQERRDPGHLGILLAEIPEALRAHLGVEDGAMAQDVLPGSPAEKAGLLRFDVLLAVNGEAVQGPGELKKKIASLEVGDKVKLKVLRGNDRREVEVTLGAQPAEAWSHPTPRWVQPFEPFDPFGRGWKHEGRKGFLGVSYAQVPAERLKELGSEQGTGVLVHDVWDGSAADRAGIEKDDIIVAIDGKEVRSFTDAGSFLADKRAGDEVTVDYLRAGERKSVRVKLDSQPGRLSREIFGPRTWHRGKVIFRDPDGDEHAFDIPDVFFQAKDGAENLFDDLELKFEQLRKEKLPQIKLELRRALRDLEQKLRDDTLEARGGDTGGGTHSSSVVRVVEGGYEVTFEEEDGVGRVTVKKDGTTLAENLPYEKVETLPRDAQERVEKVKDSLKTLPGKDRKPHRLRLEKGDQKQDQNRI